jgi:putative endonuclease
LISAAADGSSSLLSGTKAPKINGAFFMTFTVYILFSANSNKHYTGFTSNLEQRLLSHNELVIDWTARYRPWKLIYTKAFDNKNEAMVYEKWLKTGVGRDFIKTIQY